MQHYAETSSKYDALSYREAVVEMRFTSTPRNRSMGQSNVLAVTPREARFRSPREREGWGEGPQLARLGSPGR